MKKDGEDVLKLKEQQVQRLGIRRRAISIVGGITSCLNEGRRVKTTGGDMNNEDTGIIRGQL